MHPPPLGKYPKKKRGKNKFGEEIQNILDDPELDEVEHLSVPMINRIVFFFIESACMNKDVESIVSVPSRKVGLVIGKGGEMVRNIMQDTQTLIRIDTQPLHSEESSIVHITGLFESGKIIFTDDL